MNVLLTWASGGTPPGKPDADSDRRVSTAVGAGRAGPDHSAAGRSSSAATRRRASRSSSIPAPARPLRAVDLLPGTPAIVRRATVSVRAVADARAAGMTPERLIALWLPGDHPVRSTPDWASRSRPHRARRADPLPEDVAARAAGDDGPEHASGCTSPIPPPTEVQVLRAFTPSQANPQRSRRRSTKTFAPSRSTRIRTCPATNVTAVAIRPDGSREELIAFRRGPTGCDATGSASRSACHAEPGSR